MRKLIALLLALFLLMGCAAAQNLIVNGGFEDTDSEGLPRGWETDAYRSQPGYTLFLLEEGDSPDGGNCAVIENLDGNDARFAQSVEVEPESLYRVSCWVRVDDEITAGRAANISVDGLYVFSQSVTKTDGWQKLEWYGETGEDQDEVTIFVRLGGYGGESEGRACFDGIEMVAVDEVPGDGVAALWFTSHDPNYSSWDDGEADEEDGVPSPAWPLLCVLAVVFLAASLLLLPELTAQRPSLTGKQRFPWAVALGLLLAAAVRLVLAVTVRGYDVDTGCFTAWGSTMRLWGTSAFYTTTSFCDYPPLYLWVLGFNSTLAAWLGNSTAAVRFAFRFVPIVCDVTAGALVFAWAQKRGMDRRAAGLLGLFLAFNPASALNSACWGQMDSVLCLGMLVVVWLAMEHKWLPLMPVYMLCVLLKPQALMVGPLGLIAIAQAWIADKKVRRSMLIGVGIAVAAALAVIIPFTGSQNWDWIIGLYGKTLSSYPYATVNTANLYYLLGGNWSPIAQTASVWTGILLAIGSAAWGFLRLKALKGQKLAMVESGIFFAFAAVFAMMTVLGVSWTVIGTAAMALAFAVVLPLYLRAGKAENLPLLGALLFLLLYVLGIKMHERYLFPALFLLALAFALKRDWRLIVLLAVTTCTLFVNEGIILDNSIRLGSSLGHLNQDTLGLACVLSVLNLLCVPLAMWTAQDLCMDRILALPKLPVKEKAAEAKVVRDPSLHWTKRDWLLMLSVTLVYAVVAMTNLGSTKAPQNAWTSSGKEEAVVFDLGENVPDYRILYHARVSYSEFEFAFSKDGENWSEPFWAQMDQGQCFRWMYASSYTEYDDTRNYDSYGEPEEFATRYVRVTADQIGLALNEIVFRTADGRILPVTIVSRTGANEGSPLYSDAAALIDEQDTLEGEPGWYNGTYFDEIYHARTAYEHLMGTAPYETTHPPLGKLMMSVAVAVFGMTPFGWRFAGAFIGILMLPAMYLLGKQLTKRSSMAFLAMTMLALDCMHFTQTRIATIDSFPVFFIMLSFLFMLRFMQHDVIRDRLTVVVRELALCGFFMGLSVCSKWIGCYAGVGLAVLYFWTLAAQMIEARKAGVEGVWRRACILCGWCVLFFVLIPVCCYLLCYVPYYAYLRLDSFGAFVKRVIEAQQGMLNYHGTPGLGMNHPYYSPWYEWPLIQRPMWYAMAAHVPEGYSYSIFCFGNPAVWLAGLVGLAFTAALWLKRHFYVTEDGRVFHWKSAAADLAPAYLLIGFLAQFLPWVLVPRGTYIYHYFASIPFLCLAVMLLFDRLTKKQKKAGMIAMGVYLAACLVLFIAFFPYASGALVPTAWLDFLKPFLRVYY